VKVKEISNNKNIFFIIIVLFKIKKKGKPPQNAGL